MRLGRLIVFFAFIALAASMIGATVASANPPRPNILPRNVWDPNNECAPRSTPQLGEVQVAFVHHTYMDPATPVGRLFNDNNYSPEEAPGRILQLCRFHQQGQGWDDVGYHFFVDRFGTIYEGRAGGVDQPLVGAQTYGYNRASTGVALLGQFQNEPPTEEALRSAAALIAWKLTLHGAPVVGQIQLQSSAADRRVRNLDRISGHCHGFATECPGVHGVPQLDRIRAYAEEIVRNSVSAPVTQPAPPPPPVPAPAPVPAPLPAPPTAKKRTTSPFALTVVRLTKTKFRVGQRVPLTFNLTNKAKVELKVKRAGKVVGTLTHNGKAGSNKTTFTGKVKRHGKLRPLAAGKYVAFIVAKNSNGQSSAVKKAPFQIIKKK